MIELTGSPYEMGRQQGDALRPEIKNLLKRVAELPTHPAGRPDIVLRSVSDAEQFLGTAELEELQGLADGLGIHVGNVIAHNLALLPDYAAGCTQFATTAQANGGEMLHAVNEDAPLALRIPVALERVVQVRRPQHGIPYVTFSMAGQFGGYNGMNAHGVAVTSTLLIDRPQPVKGAAGHVHAAVVKAVLEGATDLDAAVTCIQTAPRLGAWSMCLSHAASDSLCYLEYDGDEVRVDRKSNRVLQTNHSLLGPQPEQTPAHSSYRLAHLEQLLAIAPITLTQAQATLRDRHDPERGRRTEHPTMNTICRVDNQISIVMQPGSGQIWVTPGPKAIGATDEFFCVSVPTIDNVASAETPHRDASEQRATPAALPIPETNISSRFVLGMIPKPQPANTFQKPTFHGAARLIGDNPVVEALRDELTQLGTRCHVLSPTDDPAQAVAELDRLWQRGPIPHLFLLTPRDAGAASNLELSHWQSRQARGVLVPYFLCQRWVKLVTDAGLMDDASLVGVASLGGDFGFSDLGSIPAVESGAITGLLKSIIVESWVAGHRTIPIKIIDAPPEESPAGLVSAICRELATPSYDVEIGYSRGERTVVRAVPESLAGRPRRPIPRGGVWVCTGGARGITAFVAHELGRRYGLRLHLVGTAPPPQIHPSWRDLSEEATKQLRLGCDADGALRRAKSAGDLARYRKSLGDRRYAAGIRRRGRRRDLPFLRCLGSSPIGSRAGSHPADRWADRGRSARRGHR